MNKQIARVLNKVGGTWGVYAEFLDDKEQIISINTDKTFNAASINKVPIAVATLKAVEENKINLSDKLILAEDQKLPGTGVLNLFTEGLEFTVRDGLSLMLAQSDNTAAKMLGSKVGPAQINNYLAQINLANTRLEVLKDNKFYYGDTSPKELAQILAGLYYANSLSKENSQLILEIMRHCHLNWGIERHLPGVEASNKEGTWEDNRHEVAIVWARKPYVVAIFSEGLKDQSFSVDNSGVLAIAEVSRLIYNETQ